jgi:chlorophyll synthase
MGVAPAARFACMTMASAQIVVIALLAVWGYAISALVVTAVLAAQIAAMPKLIRDPAKYAPWYNGVGVTLYVLGMLAASLGLGGYI